MKQTCVYGCDGTGTVWSPQGRVRCLGCAGTGYMTCRHGTRLIPTACVQPYCPYCHECGDYNHESR